MNKIHIRPYTTNDYISVRRNMEEGGLYYPEIDAEQKLNEKITRNPESILVTELNGAVIGSVFIVEDGWAPFFFRLAVPAGAGIVASTRTRRGAFVSFGSRNYSPMTRKL